MTTPTVDRSGFIDVQIVRDVAVITMRRPEKLNALNEAMRRELAALIREHGDGTGARGIVLVGTGRAFSAGEDLATTTARDDEAVAQAVETFHDITVAILATRVPVIAAVNGLAVGGASEVTMCCDARIGTPRTEYFMPENQLGLTISNASSILLRRLVGNHAHRIVLGSPRVAADEALAIGLIDDLVAEDQLIDAAIDLVHAWSPEGGATATHLALLRPQPEDIRAAIERENAAAREVYEDGILAAGIERFWRSKNTGS